MIRLIAFLLVRAGDRRRPRLARRPPGTIVVDWQGYVAETSVFRAFIILLLLIGLLAVAWSLLRCALVEPGQRRPHPATAGGRSAGSMRCRAASSPSAPATARSPPATPARRARRCPTSRSPTCCARRPRSLTGDRTTSRRIFEAMLASPDTEQLGLRGLFLEAQREGEQEAARQFAERALKLNPKLDWPVEALFDLQCRAGDWQGALDTLAIGRRNGLIDKTVANRRRAVLLTAQAQAAEDTGPTRRSSWRSKRIAWRPIWCRPPPSPAASWPREATRRAPRACCSRPGGSSPHPDLAAAYAYARPGDSPRDRLNRVRHLARLTPNDSEAPIALAITAIEAREWDEARKALEPLLEDRLTQRVSTLMARIEGEQHGHTGRVREWLARAVNAPRDPAWTADGVVSDRWAPISPVTGALDAFRWRVPVEAAASGGALLSAKVEALVGLGAGREPAHRASDAAAAAALPPRP